MFIDKKQKVNKIQVKDQNVKYGFLSRHNNNSLYINISSWVKIVNDSDKDFNHSMKLKLKQIKQLISNYNDKFFDNTKTIVTLDIRKNGFVYNTKSFLTIEITLFTKNESTFFIPNEELNTKLLNIINDVVDNNLIDSTDFSYSIKK